MCQFHKDVLFETQEGLLICPTCIANQVNLDIQQGIVYQLGEAEFRIPNE